LSTTAASVEITEAERGRIRRVRPRFLTLADVAEILNISAAQAYALVRRGEIRAIKDGGRGQWRIEHDEVERYIEECYAEVAREIAGSELARGPSAATD
jgi:excisionase family DNA binding protein